MNMFSTYKVCSTSKIKRARPKVGHYISEVNVKGAHRNAPAKGVGNGGRYISHGKVKSATAKAR
jgi:hypothetical protein